MPLSEADFYAYSRATGTPVPRDAQERAEIAPQVLGFRQGQLSATKEELDQGNFIDTAGKTALLAGLGAGAIALGTGGRFGKLRDAIANRVRPKDKGATAGVRPVDLNVEDIPVERVSVKDVTSSAPGTRTAPRARTTDIPIQKVSVQDITRPSEVSPSNLALPEETAVGRKQRIIQEVLRRNPRGAGTSADVQFTPKGADVDISARTGREGPLPEYLARARETSPERFQELDILQGNMDMADLFYRTKGTGKDVPALPAAMTPRSYLESTGAVAPAPSSALRKGRDPVDVLLDEREAAEIRRIRQADRAQEAKIIGKGERVLAELQAETLVEKQNARRPLVSEQSVEAVDTGADQVFGRVMEDVQRNEDLNISSAATYLNNRRDEIASMLGEQGLAVTPGRIEEALGYEFGPKAYTFGPKQTQRKQALQLGATYNTDFFENLKTPSVQIAGETVPTSSLKQPTVMKETAERLASQAGGVKKFLEDVRLDVEPRIEGLTVRRDQLIEKQRDLLDKQNMALAYLGKNPGLGSPRDNSLTGYLRQINSELKNIDSDLNYVDNKLGGLSNRLLGAEEYTQSKLSSLKLPNRLKSGIEEGQRIFFEQDPKTLEPMPGTQKIVSERKMIDTETKGGGGRKVAEYTGGGRMGDTDVDLDAIISNVQTKQDYREYDPDQFAGDKYYKHQFSDPADRRRWTGDRTQTGREIDRYGIRLSSQRQADTSLKPSTPAYTRAEISEATEELTKVDPRTGRKIRPRRADVIQSMGSQPKTPEGLASIDVSRELTALQRQANQGNPRAQAQLKSFIQNMRV